MSYSAKSSTGAPGFTLVELLVAIALSLAIIASATAAITMVAKVIGRSEQLSRHNQTVRELYRACTDDADFWWSLDNPFDATQQPYRTITGGTGDANHAYVGTTNPKYVAGDNGHPFVPMQLPADYWNLRAHDPGYWQRIGSYRKPRSDNRNFSLISHIGDASGLEPWRATAHVHQDRTLNLLGIFGMMEYHPPAWSWWYSLTPTGHNSFGDVQQFHYFTNPDDWGVPAKFMYAKVNALSGGVDDNGPRLNQLHGVFVGTIARQSWALDYNATRVDVVARQAIALTDDTVFTAEEKAEDFSILPPYLRSRPPGWPLVRGGLMRNEDGAGRAATIDGVLIDPITGERTTYHFMLIATTLRGARQQRDWPHWSPSAIKLDRVGP